MGLSSGVSILTTNAWEIVKPDEGIFIIPGGAAVGLVGTHSRGAPNQRGGVKAAKLPLEFFATDALAKRWFGTSKS